MLIYHVLDYFFFFFHTTLIFFNTLGWIFLKTRKWNLLTLMLTAFSWFVLGIWYGWGYCLCSDWHWMVRHKLGYYDMSSSYIHFLVLKLTGIDFSLPFINTVTVLVFFMSFMLSIWINIRDYRRKKFRSPRLVVDSRAGKCESHLRPEKDL